MLKKCSNKKEKVFEIRKYVLHDIPYLVKLCEKFIKDKRDNKHKNFFSKFEFCGAKVYDFLEKSLDDPYTYCSVLIKDGKICAALVGQLCVQHFSDQLYSEDIIMFSEKGKVSIKEIKSLLIDFENWSKQNEAEFVVIRSSTNYKPASFGRLLGMFKYNFLEVGFWKGLK